MAVVVITGASSGIGEATARVLAGHGHKLVLAARRADRLEALAAELQSRTEVLVVLTDVSQFGSLEALAARTVDRFGAIDVWINNAGVGGGVNWWEATPAEIEQVVDVNLTAPLLGARAALAHMLPRRKGHIINISSVAGHIAVAGLYSATKFGLRGHTLAMRRELQQFGIEVSLVSPGFVQSEMTAKNKMKMPPPEIIGHAIARLIRRPRAVAVVPGWYRLLIGIETLFPWLVDLLTRGFMRKKAASRTRSQ